VPIIQVHSAAYTYCLPLFGRTTCQQQRTTKIYTDQNCFLTWESVVSEVPRTLGLSPGPPGAAQTPKVFHFLKMLDNLWPFVGPFLAPFKRALLILSSGRAPSGPPPRLVNNIKQIKLRAGPRGPGGGPGRPPPGTPQDPPRPPKMINHGKHMKTSCEIVGPFWGPFSSL
jgi:hypothetical protein